MCQSKHHVALVPFPQMTDRHVRDSCEIAAGNERRIADASHDLDFPEVPFPSSRILNVVGEALLRKLVRRHHDLLRASEIGDLFSSDEAEYQSAVTKIADFVVESCGGRTDYTMKHGKTCMRVRHFPFDIDETAREIWLSCLWQALEETEWPSAVREEYWNWMEPFSIRMINRRTFRSQPKRYPFDRVKQPQRRAPFAVCPR